MSNAISANKAELLAIADAVAREKLIDKAIVLEAMEDAIQRAARARYGAENDIRAKIDANSGDMRLWRVVVWSGRCARGVWNWTWQRVKRCSKPYGRIDKQPAMCCPWLGRWS
mgnify:CR=1 FL=1